MFFKQKSPRFEVDQSIRIEQLKEDTIISLANEQNKFTIKIKSKTKRQLYEFFRQLDRPKQYAPIIFAIGIVLLIKYSKFKVNELVLDIEYPGYEKIINRIIHSSVGKDALIYTESIGKKSPAHYAAYGVHIGKESENLIIKKDEILNITKKTLELLHC